MANIAPITPLIQTSEADPDNPVRASTGRTFDRWLVAIVVGAVALRLMFVLVLDPAPQASGGDVYWYLENGLRLVTNTQDLPLQPGPTFLVYVGLIQIVIQGSVQDAILVIRLLNVGWHVALICSVYALGRVYFDRKTARLAAAVLAINPVFVIETGAPLTESLFLGLLFGALALFALNTRNIMVIVTHSESVSAVPPSPRLTVKMAFVGALLGLAALTRVVILLFPAVIVVSLIWRFYRQLGWRGLLRPIMVLLLSFALVVSTWTVYNLLRWNRFVIGGEGLTAFAFMGATGITDAHEVDAQLGDAAIQNQRDGAFIQGFLTSTLSDLPGWLGRRLSNLGEAYIQPHNTVYFAGESLRALAITWLTEDRGLDGLIRLIQGDAFWPKLALWVFHLWTLVGGTLGMLVLVRRRMWQMLPLFGFVAYITVIHFVLFANPRYVFPTMPIFTLFACSITLRVVQRRPSRGKQRHLAA